MSSRDQDFRSVNEIGKIFNSLTDKQSLCEFFLQSTSLSINADQGYLFLCGREDQLWLAASLNPPEAATEDLQEKAQEALIAGKPLKFSHHLWLPLIVRNSAIGIACFSRGGEKAEFSKDDRELAFDLASQMAGSLKNILLFETNLEMEKLAAVGKSMTVVLHEIKNIIQLATFAEEWLTKALEKPERKYLERGVGGIQKALKEMNGFVHEMLSLTKNYKIIPQKVNLTALVKELDDDLRDRAGEDIKLDFQVEEGLGEVDAEERSLYRALLNLIKNAIEACDKEKSFIRLRAQSVDSGHYVIEITDNGQGMSDEVKAKLFQAFFSTKGEKGTGLGVMIVDRTIKAHQGKIDLQSKAGEGTTFTLTLPKVIRPL